MGFLDKINDDHNT